MTTETKISKTKLSDLIWVQDNQPFNAVPKSGPRLANINRYVDEGLVEKAHVEEHHKLTNAGVTVYKLTRAGKRAIKAANRK